MIKLRFRPAAALLAALAAASILFPALWRWDNKYTRQASQPIGGVLMLSQQDLEAHPLRYLIREWEYYPGALLEPADFTPPPDLYRQYVSVGQYGGIEAGNPARPAHGSGTYRLTLNLPGPSRDWALELPQVYSACRLYIDGRLALELGDPSPASYVPRTQERMAVFYGEGRVRLLLAVTDQSAVYGGLVYPPAFGELPAVERARGLRFFLRTAAFLAAAAGAALSLYFGLRLRHGRGVRFALLCFCAAGYLASPLLHTAFPLPVQPWDAAEALCLHAMPLLTAALLNNVRGIRGKPAALSLAFCGLACLMGTAMSLLSPWLSPGAMNGFSTALGLARAGTAVYLLGAAGLFQIEGEPSPLLLGGAAFYGASLLWDRLLPLYEPVYGGWFPEIGGIALVCVLGFALWDDLSEAYRFRAAFAQEKRQMERQLAMQKEHYRQLGIQVQEAREASHDLRHHMRALGTLAAAGNLAAVQEYLEGFAPSISRGEIATYTSHFAADAVVRFYEGMAREAGAEFSASLRLPPDLEFPDDELCILLGNLLENAVEASARMKAGRRFVTLRANVRDGRLGLVVENSFQGMVRMKNSRFCSSKREGIGLGIRSVQAVAERRGGLCDFSPEGDVFRAWVLIPLEKRHD